MLGTTVLDSGQVLRTFAPGTSYETFSFNVSGVGLTSGNNYTVEAFVKDLTGSVPTYASFDGLEMQGVLPEPGTALLLASGLIGLGCVGRRRLH
jgi:hypothetical protein